MYRKGNRMATNRRRFYVAMEFLRLASLLLSVAAQGVASAQVPFYQGKTLTDEATPLMPDEMDKALKELPRDPETVALFEKLNAVGRLPAR
jgi:hypothetical protein